MGVPLAFWVWGSQPSQSGVANGPHRGEDYVAVLGGAFAGEAVDSTFLPVSAYPEPVVVASNRRTVGVDPQPIRVLDSARD